MNLFPPHWQLCPIFENLECFEVISEIVKETLRNYRETTKIMGNLDILRVIGHAPYRTPCTIMDKDDGKPRVHSVPKVPYFERELLKLKAKSQILST